MKTRLKNATLSLRVPSAFWDTDSGFSAFLEFAAEFNFVEEYAFFSTPLIGRPFPVDYLRRYWEKLGERIEKTRAFAPRVGINHLVTIGHNYHGGEFFAQSPAHLVNHEGTAVRSIRSGVRSISSRRTLSWPNAVPILSGLTMICVFKTTGQGSFAFVRIACPSSASGWASRAGCRS